METQTEMNVQKPKPSLIGMFTSPGEQFERIKQNPRIWVPLLIISILYVIGMVLMALSMDTALLIDQGLTKEQAEVALGVTKISTVVMGIFIPIITVVLSSAVQLIIAKIASSNVSFKQLFSMNTHIMVIGAVGAILNMAIRYAIGGSPDIFITSLAGLLNQEKAGVLGSFELFSIWSMILTAIGLNKTAEFSKGLAWTIAIIFFLIQVGFALIGTLLQGVTQ
jgi:hypothetical protein